jgi:hypothetical protein
MRRTVTQLAESLNIDKAAVHRHLKKLEEGGLVKRYEEHGFVYYGLSWKARDLMSPNENTRVIVMLSSSWVLSIMIVFLVLASLVSLGSVANGGQTGDWYFDKQTSGTGDSQLSAADSLSWIVFIAPAAALAVVVVMLAGISVRTIVKPKQPSNEPRPPSEG